MENAQKKAFFFFRHLPIQPIYFFGIHPLMIIKILWLSSTFFKTKTFEPFVVHTFFFSLLTDSKIGNIGGEDIWEISQKASPLGYWNWTWWIILNADSEICISPYFHNNISASSFSTSTKLWWYQITPSETDVAA